MSAKRDASVRAPGDGDRGRASGDRPGGPSPRSFPAPAAKNERQAFAEALAQKLTVTYETGGNERPDAWDRLREATIAAKAAWCHCSCDSCVSRGEHHPADCPAPECPWTGPTDMVG